MRVLSIGECMAELSRGAEAGDFRLGFAGDTFNTAWYLARIAPQIDVDYLTAVGDDAISGDMVRFMAQAGIGTRHIAAVPDRTVGLYLITLTEGERSFSYWRGQSAARLLAQDRGALRRAMEGAAIIYFSGITLAILDAPGRARLIEACTEARATGARIAFDPNLRPRLWASTNEMTEAITRGAEVADLVLPSFDDEATWFGDTTPADTLRRYPAPKVIVKNGPGAIHWRDGMHTGQVQPSLASHVVDTTAAGDSFNAGFLAGFEEGAAMPDAIARGAALAAQVIGGKGALVPVPR